MRYNTIPAALALLFLTAAAHAAEPLPAITQQFLTSVQNAQTLSFDAAHSVAGARAETIHFVFSRPNKMLLVTGGDAAITLVSDGKTLSEWDDKNYQKQVAPPSLNDLFNPVLLSGNHTALIALMFTVYPQWIQNAGLADTGTDTINGVTARKLVGSDQSGTVRFWLSTDTGLPVRLVIDRNYAGQVGNEYTLDFSHYAVNQPVDTGTFAAVPPPGLTDQKLANRSTLDPGTLAPDFTLTGIDGKSITLSALQGKTVMVVFWSSWADSSADILALALKLSQDLGGKGLEVLAINSWDTPEARQAFLKDHPMGGLTILNDPAPENRSVATGQYRLFDFPAIYLIDKNGKVVSEQNGHNPDEVLLRRELASLGVL